MPSWSEVHNGCKVLLALHSSFPHAKSGYAVRSHSIATFLRASGVDSEVYTRPGFPWVEVNAQALPPGRHDELDGVVYHRLPHLAPEQSNCGERYRAMSLNLFARVIRQTGARIVHAASDIENGWPAVMAGRDRGIKSIYEYRGMWHYTRASRIPWFPTTEEYAERHALELETGKQADAVFAISEALRDELAGQGVAAEKITVLPNAVDGARFAPMPPDKELKATLGLAGRKVVGFIGSVTVYEGLERLMDAVLELNAQGANLAMLVVGDGPHSEILGRHHVVYGQHDAIVLAGRVPFADVQRYYSIIDIMAFPRINARVCQCVPPLKPLEAMAMGKPVIVSDVAALCEMVEHEKTGLVCRADDTASLAEHLGRMVDSPRLCAELADNAAQWVREHRDWNVVGQRILRVYEELAG
ncbi:glycosyltransferase family 4 protein [Desulfolutivibrio sulfoxidireducens]|uniref:glycosyltransferase family 4 protein n=1 Tax=Desulfolutivibrio sulfoxidireducens TaxID=2773299 RepID=UPI00159D8BE9|nr:glycosyltransferase family 4 protein [Desulfolutivibrio sulfoxidireducens]QLA15816.1 glycosyltransferase [Desulfolutivibrio sulfoxidireducens]QLA20281.1 glycosyltransferase [Desulfolutivibrio sulfoxidireducens]